MKIIISGTDGFACVMLEGFMLVGLILNRQRKGTWKGEREDTWKANHGKHENNT